MVRDCDNGHEFLNHGMVAWCKARKITFTRSRAYRKNDQAHVEEKNGSIVRRLVGYERFEGHQSYEILMAFYSVSRLYVNYFQPSMKLINKTRVGARVSKKYDTARTPLERLLGFQTISKKNKSNLLAEFRRLDPVKLLADMARLQTKLWQTSKQTSKLVLETQCATFESPQPNETKRGPNNRNVNKSNAKSTKQHSIPKRAARRRRRPANSENGRKSVPSTRIDITQDFVDNAVHPSSRKHEQIIFRDSKLIGFGLRLNPRSSTKSFVVEARVNGRPKRITIGRADLFSADEARFEAVQLLRQMTSGMVPLTLRKKRKD
jgi:hypothetical protein